MQSPELLLFLKAPLLEAFWHRQREVGEVLVRCAASHFPNVNKSHRIAFWYRKWRKQGRERWNRVHILRPEHSAVPLLLPNPPSGLWKIYSITLTSFSLWISKLKQSYLINLFFVQVKNLTRTCWGNLFIDLVTNMIPVITVSSQHKYHLD